MEYNNFLITGFGRSGTKFLSTLMNKSNKWLVLHEPRGKLEMIHKYNNLPLPILTKKHFNRNFYGEVNSVMRHYFDDIEVRKKGIIFREPKEIILSACNRKNLNQSLKTIDYVYFFWESFKEKVRNDKNIFVIDFNLMVTDKLYLKKILNHFEINDVHEINLKKINKTRNKKFDSFDDLPKSIKDKYNSLKWSQ